MNMVGLKTTKPLVNQNSLKSVCFTLHKHVSQLKYNSLGLNCSQGRLIKDRVNEALSG